MIFCNQLLLGTMSIEFCVSSNLRRKSRCRKPRSSFFTKVFFAIFLINCSNISRVSAAQPYARANRHPPRIVDSDISTLSAFAGQMLTLPCMVSGKPPPEISWSKDGEQIGLDWGRFKQKRNSLRIRDVQSIDSGLYVCHAVNGFGSREVKIRLVVYDEKSSQRENKKEPVKPTFSHPVKMRRNNYVKPQGGTVSFRCRARGNPKPQIHWYKDANQTELMPSLGTIRPQWTLTLHDIRPEDSGRYTCHVWNKAGEITFQYTLRVVGSTNHERPIILKPHPVNTTAQPGEKTSLQCKIRSLVPPTVKWIKRLDPSQGETFKANWPNNSLRIDGKLYLILPPQQMMRLPDGSYLSKLVIDPVKDGDAGMYICLGANTMGYNFRYAYLSVNSNHIDSVEARTSFDLIIGVAAGAALLLLVVVALSVKCICSRKQTSFSKPPHASSDEPRSSSDSSCLHVRSSEVVALETSKNHDESSHRLLPAEKMNYSNPLHSVSSSQSVSGSSQKPEFSSCAPYPSDPRESDTMSHCICPPPPPPPSQYSRTSSWDSSSRVQDTRCQHVCQGYRSPRTNSLPSSYSHIYEDF